ncbi:hypothetical protein GDO78_019037 [Eleutherodactylus coqui]|uniref:Taste receptor type 2 n=1 Tax=Eleutherodactylus coqui TaxID=57060 RepID=A0A8J6BJY1_ELECQ|nr:hypothetical protein GDO78_019037 [Eleutherodactylus coqui]
MADSTEGDTAVLYLGLLSSALITLIAGQVIHSFIIGVNVTDWWKGRSVTPVDHVVTCLGISRMCIQCVNILYFFMYPLFRQNLDSLVITLIGLSCDSLIYANMWLTSLFSIVLCLKISNFHTRLFLYLRGMIVHRTVYLIGASVLLSAVYSLITLLFTVTKISSGGTYNATMANAMTNCADSDYVYPVTIGVSFPLFFYCISSVVLFTSLYHHTTKMKMSSNLSINLETYYSVMKFVSVTFIYNTIYFICYICGILYYYIYCVNPDRLYIVLDFLTVLHSSYLIYKTAKLRSQMSRVLQDVTDFLFQSKDTETRENIEVIAL